MWPAERLYGEGTLMLFHFTNAPAATIKAEGLRPGANSWADYVGFVVPKEPVVWLMAEFCPTSCGVSRESGIARSQFHSQTGG